MGPFSPHQPTARSAALRSQPPLESAHAALDDLRGVALDHAGLGIALLHERGIVRCNQRFAELFGYADRSGVQGLHTSALYADRADYRMLTAVAYPVMGSGKPYSAELRLRRRDDSDLWARVTGTMVEPGNVQRGTVWIVEHIDARKRTEAALAAAREEHALIFDNANVGMVYLRERRVTRCNRAFEQLFGWAPGELDGRSSREWYGSAAAWEAAGRRCYAPFAQDRAFEGEMVLLHRDGHEIECDVRSRAIDPANPERSACCCCPTRCAARSNATSCRWSTSRSRNWPAAASSVPRRCCAGTIQSSVRYRRPSSSRSPSRAA
jgi:PAS domain S-box-containing protein